MMRLVPSVLLMLVPLVAQKMPLRDASERIVALVDVGDLLGSPPGAGDDAGTPRAVEARAARLARDAGQLVRIAAFVRAFAEPALTGDADLQVLGDHHLVLLGTPAQSAGIEQLLAATRRASDTAFQLDFRIYSVPPALFDKDVKKLLAKPVGEAEAATQVAVLSPEGARELKKAITGDKSVELVQAPNIITEPMQHATIAVGDSIAYVRDFKVETVKDALIADPVIDTIFDGLQVEAICAQLLDGTIGIQMKVLDQKVERPIRQFNTTIPGTTFPVTLQVPRTSGCQASQTAALPSGSTAVMAAQKRDGTWLVSLMTVSSINTKPGHAGK